MGEVGLVLIVIGVVCIIIMGLLFSGVIQAFQRQPIVAALFLIFLTPVFVAWVIVEALFLSSPKGG